MTRIYNLPKSNKTTFNVCIVTCNYLDPNGQQERSMRSLPEKLMLASPLPYKYLKA